MVLGEEEGAGDCDGGRGGGVEERVMSLARLMRFSGFLS